MSNYPDGADGSADYLNPPYSGECPECGADTYGGECPFCGMAVGQRYDSAMDWEIDKALERWSA